MDAREVGKKFSIFIECVVLYCGTTRLILDIDIVKLGPHRGALGLHTAESWDRDGFHQCRCHIVDKEKPVLLNTVAGWRKLKDFWF